MVLRFRIPLSFELCCDARRLLSACFAFCGVSSLCAGTFASRASEMPTDSAAHVTQHEINSEAELYTNDEEPIGEDINSYDLDEFVVTGDNQIATSNGVLYTPTANSKKMAHSGVSLISAMAIPTLKVNQVTETVTTISDQPVTLFIDYLEASPEEVNGLNPQDVLRVDVLSSPQDIRFKNKENVVNFIMKKRNTGGYLKLGASQSFEVNKGIYSIYSKNAWTNTTLDVNAGAGYYNSHHSGQHSLTSYTFPDQKVDVEQTPEEAKEKGWNCYVNARPVWRKDNIVISNTLSLTAKGVPNKHLRSLTTYNPQLFADGDQTDNENSRRLYLAFEGEYQFILPQGWSLLVQPWLKMSRNSLDTEQFNTDDIISNDIRENRYFALGDVQAAKQFSQNHALSLAAHVEYSDYHLDYSGSTNAKQTLSNGLYQLRMQYMLNLNNFNLNLSAHAGYNRQTSGITATSDFYRGIEAFAGWRIKPGHSLSASAGWYNRLPDMALLNDVAYTTGLLTGTRGNPYLKSTGIAMANLNYNWIIANKLSSAFNIGWTRTGNNQVYDYRPELIDGRMLMVTQPMNVGFVNTLRYGYGASTSLLNNSLSISGFIGGLTTFSRSINHFDSNVLTGSIQASYSFRNFYIMGHWDSRSKLVKADSEERRPQVYYIAAGYGTEKFNVSLTAYNFCQSKWSTGSKRIDSTYMTSFQQSFGDDYHRAIFLELAWYIGYGKKVERNAVLPTDSDDGGTGIFR